MKFVYLEDVATADVAFKAEGKNLNELFENAAMATAETLANTKTIKQKVIKRVSIEEEDIEQMLYAFLSEIVYLKDADLLFFSKFDVTINNGKLVARMYGEKVNDQIELRTDVKAVTMYMLKVENKKDKCCATVVLDL
ncbi:archease [archaeon]|nr:archease [archaeon]MBL7056663.1 archease [Candidatus Woesearchaeota archaeon]